MPWFVYLIECLDGSLYTGAATDVARRFDEHRRGRGARYTRSHPPLALRAVIACTDRSEALRREWAIKRLPVAAKRELCLRHPPDGEISARLCALPPAALRAGAETIEEARMLKTGDKAPDFSLPSDTGHIIDSAALKGRRYVLYFYPKDDTPGCTREACAFRDNLPGFGKLSVPVFGVSADDEKRHAKFVHKYSLNFPLLSDPDHELLEAYGVWVEKSLYGRKYMGIARCSFVVDAKGRIEKVWDKVNVDTHAAEVLSYLGGQPVAGAPATPAKKTAGKLAKPKPIATKKPAAKKAATKKTPTKKTPTKKPVAKKAATKKTATRKTVRKAVAKKKPATRR